MKREFTLRALNGTNIVSFHSLFDIDARHGAKVVSEPIEEGSFTTYNKTISAIEYRIRIIFTGTDAEIGDSLSTLEDLQRDTTVFSLVTPYFEKRNLTLGQFDYRLEKTVGLLEVEAQIVEIREVFPEYTNTTIRQADSQDPSNTSTVDNGTTQAEEPKDPTLLRKLETIFT